MTNEEMYETLDGLKAMVTQVELEFNTPAYDPEDAEAARSIVSGLAYEGRHDPVIAAETSRLMGRLVMLDGGV